jgi:fumarate reductase subunit C
MAYVRTFVRPMRGWWRRNPYYRWYMLREATALFVAAYALVLLVGLARLAQGRDAYESWRAALTSPLALGFHAVALAAFAYHAWTWFAVMPKTLPFVTIAGRRVPDRTIVASGVIAACAASLALFVVVRILAA